MTARASTSGSLVSCPVQPRAESQRLSDFNVRGEDARRKLRLQRNRESARKSRLLKKTRAQRLGQEVNRLSSEVRESLLYLNVCFHYHLSFCMSIVL
jgi:hypothetical protein